MTPNEPAEAAMTLDKLKDGQQATVQGLQLGSTAAVRLMEMGLFEGSPVRVLRRAPMGDPLEVQVGDYRLSLRKDEAALVRVQL
jgi:ferrous iron transport protein A